MGIRSQTQIKATAKPSFTPMIAGFLQRKCACGQHTVAGVECAECWKKRMNIQRAAGHTDPETAPPIVHEVLHSPGQPLDAETRAFMETRLGHDFSQVRVHTDAKAANSAMAVKSLAYTVGRDIVFGVGQYQPKIATGLQLLAHELTHVVQQRDSTLNNSTGITISAPDNHGEHEAKTIANHVTSESGLESSTHITDQPILLQRHTDPDLFIPGESFYFSNQGQARIAALARATELGPGHSITHDPDPARGQPHYHVVDPSGARIRGHFFYGRRRQRKERGRRFERERAREQAESQVRELLPGWIIALLTAAALATIIACFASGVCEAAIIIGAAGAAVGAIIIGILGSVGVDVIDGDDQVA